MHILVEIRMVAHHREIPTAFNSLVPSSWLMTRNLRVGT